MRPTFSPSSKKGTSTFVSFSNDSFMRVRSQNSPIFNRCVMLAPEAADLRELIQEEQPRLKLLLLYERFKLSFAACSLPDPDPPEIKIREFVGATLSMD